jgi:hypothetical protein
MTLPDLEPAAVRAACMANFHPDAEPSATELARMEKSIRAYLAARSAVVKPLEWEVLERKQDYPKYGDNRFVEVAWLGKGTIGSYDIWAVDNGIFHATNLSAYFPVLEAARAACQADYEQRILSALEQA